MLSRPEIHFESTVTFGSKLEFVANDRSSEGARCLARVTVSTWMLSWLNR